MGRVWKTLKKLLPLLTPGQLYALVAAWTEVLAPDAAHASEAVFDPHANRDITFRRVAEFTVAR